MTEKIDRRAFLAALAAAAAPPFLPPPAMAESWPAKPVRMVVPFAPGGNTDGIARLVSQRLGEVFGQQFVVEDRPGANGQIAAETVARAPADGYTLFLAALPQIAVFPAMTKVSYDPVKDFAPVSLISTNPFVLMVHPDFPVHSVAELVARARAAGELIPYGSGGHASLTHIAMALFLKRAGIEINHVPYKGGGPAMADFSPVMFRFISAICRRLFLSLPTAASACLAFRAPNARRNFWRCRP